MLMNSRACHQLTFRWTIKFGAEINQMLTQLNERSPFSGIPPKRIMQEKVVCNANSNVVGKTTVVG